jgi:hypothetical protein
MRTKALWSLSVTLVVLLVARPLWAGPWDGTVKVGGVVMDETGDRSAVQETYNIHEGFNLARIKLNGAPGTGNYLMLDLRDIDLEGRQGDLLFRRPGLLQFSASYDQSRQVFDPDRAVASNRKSWNFGARVTPVMWLKLDGDFGTMSRDGRRLGYPPETASELGTTVSELGTGYDYSMRTGRVGAEARKDRRGAAVDLRFTDFTDDASPDADRTGKVVSVRAWTPCLLYNKLTHYFRAAYGVNRLSQGEIDHTLKSFQYTGVARPAHVVELKYNFDAQRVDDESTHLKTDRIQNNVDATLYHKDGTLSGGYGYETNDDDQHLTSYNTWRVGATMHGAAYSTKIQYAGREKKDTEKLTLLENVEASRFLADMTVKPVKDLDVGVGYNVRDRETRGNVLRGNVGYSYPGWGRISGTYTYTRDRYTDRAAGYDVNSHVVTARADLERIKNARFSGGVTYLQFRKDLDIEKSIVFMEAAYTVNRDYHFEVKYNVYNYDDYVLLDRYYTANVVWFNVAYDFHGK